MTAHDQYKLTQLGVKIFRRCYLNLVIKYKDKEHFNWVTFEKFKNKTAVNKKMEELLKSPLNIED